MSTAADASRGSASPRLTRAGVALTTSGFSLFGLGVAMGNLELLILGVLPLVLVGLALASRAPHPPRVVRTLSTRAPRRGEAFSMELRVEGVDEGALVEVHAPLPSTVTLEAGSNVALLAEDARVAQSLRGHARGRQALATVRVESIEPTALLAPATTDGAPAEDLEVAPRSFVIKRIRARAARPAASQMPDRDASRLGIESTDFRELREYAWGDAPNAINWKATARRLSALGKRGGRMASPLVNEYEKEGRRTVLILLDGGAPLRVGTSLATGLDHGVEASVAAARFFLARGSRVGAWTYGARAGPVAPPEAGSGHAHSIERALSPGDPEPSATLPAALRQLHPHLVGTRPLVVVVTRLTPENADEIAEAASRLRALLGERRRALPFFVIDVRALALAPTPDPAWRAARDLVSREDEEAARRLRRTGARVVAWRPGAEDFRRALMRGGLA